MQDDTNLSAAFDNYKVKRYDINCNIELVLRVASSIADTILSREDFSINIDVITRGKAKNFLENSLLCEYTCKPCGKRECRDEKTFFSMVIIQKMPPLLNLNPQFKV